MRYAEFSPSKRLEDIVECYWTMEGGGTGFAVEAEHVSVDPGIELFFNLGAGYDRRDIDCHETARVNGSHIVGIRTKPIVVTQAGRAHTFAVRFRPEGLARLLRFPLAEITHTVIDAKEILGSECSAVEERLYDAVDDAARVAVVEAALVRLDARRPTTTVERDAELVAAVRRGVASLDSLCTERDISYRALERSFARSVGIPPKLFAQILRWRRASQLLLGGERDPWVDEYYDQSHFIRDFRRFTGRSPGDFLARGEQISRWLLSGGEG